MAAISMTFALHTALKASLAAALLFAAVWGLAIMSLDRWLIASLVRQRNKFGYIVLALPRVALGLLFGLIISTPFTMQIFAPEINQRIAVMHHQRSEDFDKQLKTGSQTAKITQEQTQVNNDDTMIAARGWVGIAQEPHVAGLASQLDAAKAQQNRDYNLWQCQLYGRPPGCGAPAGNGQLARDAQQKYTQDNSTVSTLQTQLTAAEQTAAASNLQHAQQDLLSVSPELKAAKAVQAAQISAFDATNGSDAGLLQRLQALDQYSAGDRTLQAARWLLFLFFTAIEVLPVLTKVLVNLGPESGYERQLAEFEREGLEFGKSVLPEIVRQTAVARLRDAGTQLASQKRKEPVDVSQNGHGGTAQSRYRQGRL
jgi:hypothetical protein